MMDADGEFVLILPCLGLYNVVDWGASFDLVNLLSLVAPHRSSHRSFGKQRWHGCLVRGVHAIYDDPSKECPTY
jgi:hypothetical protein